MSDFFRNMVKELNDENTSIADDGVSSSQFSGCVDTGSYILNAALSGSLYGGVPNNKITAFAGESATGKIFSFFLSLSVSWMITQTVLSSILTLRLL